MINSQYARIGKIFPSSGTTESSRSLTSTSGLEHPSRQQVERVSFSNSQTPNRK